MRRNHARRPRFALPLGLNLADFDFQPTREEKLLDRCRQWEALWAKEDDLRRKQRAAQIAAEVAIDRRKQAIADHREAIAREVEAAIQRRRDYYLTARKAEDPIVKKLVESYQEALEGGWHRKMLARVAQITNEMERDKAKAERKELERRGLIRGRHR